MSDFEARLEELEDAHRELAAQFTALQLVCRMMLPLVIADPAEVRLRLLSAHELNEAMMNRHSFDAEYQQKVRTWLDTLSGEIMTAGRFLPHPGMDS